MVENSANYNGKICLFGGTFDPIHKGHMDMALKAASIYGFNRVIVLPTGNSYLKNNVTDTYKRCEMVSLAIEEYNSKYNDLFEISYYEARSKEPSYTYKTLSYYEKEYAESAIYYLIGEDSLRYIDKWKEAKEIFRIAHIIVARRNNEKESDNRNINQVVNQLELDYNANIQVFDYNMDISSTQIRNAIKDSDNIKANYRIQDYIPSSVLDYIRENNLYATGDK